MTTGDDRRAGNDFTRRQVLAATGTAVAAGTAASQFTDVAGAKTPIVQNDCEGATLTEVPAAFPTINLRGEEPTAADIPDSGELLVYVYGYNTPVELGRQLAATFADALDEQGYEGTVAVAEWRSQPESEANSRSQAAENFEESETNAGEDGEKLASWLEANAAGRSVRIVGYSLGSRLSLRTLDLIDGETVGLETVSLMGPAVPAGSLCADGGQFDTGAARAVFSYYSGDDGVICNDFTGYLTLFSEQDPPALGCTGSECAGSRPENAVGRDVTDRIDDHCAYGFPDVGVVPALFEDLSTPLSAIERDEGEQGDDSSDSDSSSGNRGAANEDEPESTPTATPEPTGTATETDQAEPTAVDDDGAGFGLLSALASLGTAGYLARRRPGSEE